MAGNGMVQTARGEKLNIAELIDRANRPFKKQAASEIAPRVAPKKKALNVRGHRPSIMPEASDAAHSAMRGEQVVVLEEMKAPPSSFSGGEARSMADLTGIKVDQTRSNGKRKGIEGANQALDEILGDLAATTKDSSGLKDEDLSS